MGLNLCVLVKRAFNTFSTCYAKVAKLSWGNEAHDRTPDGRAFIDIETQNFLIEVKNVSDPTLSQRFIAQAEKYLQISQAIGKPLVYYFTNQPPNAHMIEFLRRLNIIWFHTPISGGE